MTKLVYTVFEEGAVSFDCNIVGVYLDVDKAFNKVKELIDKGTFYYYATHYLDTDKEFLDDDKLGDMIEEQFVNNR